MTDKLTTITPLTHNHEACVFHCFAAARFYISDGISAVAEKNTQSLHPHSMMLAHHSGRVRELSTPAHAIVVGGSGAVGRCLVAQLAASPQYSKITCINRREWTIPVASPDQDKLRHVTCDVASAHELSAAVAKLADERISVAFCTLGTTRR